MSTTRTRLTRYMGRRSVHGLAVLADLTPFPDLPQPRQAGAAMGVFCVLCGKEQSRTVCGSCDGAKNT